MDYVLDRVDLKTEFVKKTSVHSLVYVFRSIVKLDSVICSSSQHTHLFKFHILVFGFGLTDLVFHE